MSYPDPATTRHRLGLLIQLLRALEPERFNYEVYAYQRGWMTVQDLTACGTIGCAAGHATTIPELRALGLQLCNGLPSLPPLPDKLGMSATRAMAQVFLIPLWDAQLLFLPGVDMHGLTAPGPRASAVEVADHLQTYLNLVLPTEPR